MGTQPPIVNGTVTTTSRPVVAPQPTATKDVKTVNEPPRRPVVKQELKNEQPKKEELKKDQPKKEQPKKDDKKKDDKKDEPKKD